MCLGIPAEIKEVLGDNLARVDVNGVQRDVSVALVADEGLQPGDWVLVHVGFALNKIDAAEAAMTLDQVQKMGQMYTDEIDAFKESVIA
jgi:hydrogenase expression/formation protein HypC